MHRLNTSLPFFLLGAGLLALTASPVQAQDLTGFAPSRVEAELACEAQLIDLPTPEAFHGHLERLTRDPHPTGSEANVRTAQYIGEVMQKAGLEVENYDYDLYLPGPEPDVDVALVTPIRMPLNNQEYIVKEDRFSNHPDLREGWNAFSGSGDATAEVVYANFGRKEDFEKLAELGVEVEGKVVIARYGGNFRGFKAKFAEANGAVGLLIYSDPTSGGYTSGPNYPEDRYLTESTIQRGSVIALDYWGDPLTPMEPALTADSGKKVNRLDPDEVGLHTIPVTPIPYGAAQEIMQRMKGEPVPDGWQGALPFAYRLTGGPDLTVRVRVNQPKQLTRATNVVGTIEGSEFPDEWIILGSHYDAWSFGAIDPNSGTSMLLVLAEALGQMAKDGCRPRRSIKIAHWDAEEYGIIGSTEWVEQLRDELKEKAVAYINADASVSGGNFSSSAAPSLKSPIIEATKAVPYPETDGTVYDHWMGRTPEDDEPRLGNLGGGSDHVGFYTHAGVPSSGLSMSGGGSPMYHSNYDNLAWYERFADTDFIYGPTLSRVDGILALRLANADIVPYDVPRYATDVETHAASLEKLAESLDVTINLDNLKAAAQKLGDAAEAYVAARDQRVGAGELEKKEAERINQALINLEKAFIHDEGMQWHIWSQSLYASPDPFSGYASWMLPGLRYEIETKQQAGVSEWEQIYVAAIEDLTGRVEALTQELSSR